ncbi:cleavage polyadenylation factor subunit fip1 [Marasmius tenuissimus]|nr:cleavage polyadenylation factor subunit fip1 [Marasmius tenuissimus]
MMMDDDDEEYLYGTSTKQPDQPQGQSEPTTSTGSAASYSHPKPVENTLATNGIVSQLEAAAESEIEEQERLQEEDQQGQQDSTNGDPYEDAPQEDGSEVGGDGGEESEEEDEDVEIIIDTDRGPRSIDFRPNAQRPQQNRTSSTTAQATPLRATSQPSLTTEYTPIQRGAGATPSKPAAGGSTSTLVGSQSVASMQPSASGSVVPDSVEEGPSVDTSTLPPARAPPSHPKIEPDETGMLDGRSIYEVDIGNMADKPWRRPGADISDWFNYGFDEISWEAYCYRRREMGDVAGVMKVNVLNFAGMQEDQLTALPPEVRQMVMTGTSAMMNQMNQINQAVAGAGGNMGGDMGMNPGMMAPGVMMDMGMMNPMGMGMNGDMSNMGMGQMGMPMDGQPQGVVPGGGMGGGMPGNNTPDQGGMGMMQEGGFPGAMGMGMEFGMQDNQMYPGMDQGQPVGGPAGGSGAQMPAAGARPGGATPQAIAARGRGATPVPGAVRGRGTVFPARGRGRGIYGPGEGAPSAPARPASPLPPNVPTGPRNQNKYKDRDGNAPAVDGLDYGGDRDRDRDSRDREHRDRDRGEKTRTPSREPEERSSSSRKRRSSPSLDDRSSKRR